MYTFTEPKPLTLVASTLDKITEDMSQVVLTPELGQGMFSTESFREEHVDTYKTAAEDLDTIIVSAIESFGLAQEEMTASERHHSMEVTARAATAAAFVATNPEKALEADVTANPDKGVHVNGGPINGLTSRNVLIEKHATEAYDSRSADDLIPHTITYNMIATSPSEFSKTLWSMIVIQPNSSGVRNTAELDYIQNDTLRKSTGAITDFQRRSLVRAGVNGEIVMSNLTDIIPVFTPASADKFVDPAVVATSTKIQSGQEVPTAPLLFGKEIELIGISQTNDLLSKGIMEVSDQLDTDVRLHEVYYKLGNDVIKVDVSGLVTSTFTSSTLDNTSELTLNFDSSSVMIHKDTVLHTGGTNTLTEAALTDAQAAEQVINLNLYISGRLNMDDGRLVLYGTNIGLDRITDVDGEAVALSTAPALQALVGGATFIGYTLKARRSNTNRRQRGDMLDSTSFVEEIHVPLTAPITAIRSTKDKSSAKDLTRLIRLTHLRINHEAVINLDYVAKQLEEFARYGLPNERPDNLGIGRYYVIPSYIPRDIDMLAEINSEKSHERSADIKAVLVNHLRDVATKLYIDSEYQSAAEVLFPGENVKPTVVVATDAYIASYLYESGDSRLFTNMFDFKIVTSPHKDMIGKIYLTFHIFDSNTNKATNPLNFGNLAWSPEMVFNLNLTRNGATSNELAVYPRYRFYNACPIMGALTVTNITEALSKVPLATTP